MKDKISIIVPIYNAEITIKRCISSIVQQTYQNIEIILVNDGSNDNSLLICQKYAKKDSRIILIDKKNGGVSSARNLGITKASGKFIMFCDSDDWLKPDYCEEMLHFYLDNHLLMCEIERWEKNGEVVIDQSVGQKVYLEEISKSNFLAYRKEGMGSPTNKLFKKSIIVENNITFPENLFLGEDLTFVISYLKCISGNIRYLHKKLYVYQVDSEDSLSKKVPDCYQNEFLYEILTDAVVSLNSPSSTAYQLRNKIIMYNFEKIFISIAKNNSMSFIKKCQVARKIINTKAYQECCKTGTGSSNLFYEWFYKSKKIEILMVYLCFIKSLGGLNE